MFFYNVRVDVMALVVAIVYGYKWICGFAVLDETLYFSAHLLHEPVYDLTRRVVADRKFWRSLVSMHPPKPKLKQHASIPHYKPRIARQD